MAVAISDDDAQNAADALADWINDCPCTDPAVIRALLNRIATAPHTSPASYVDLDALSRTVGEHLDRLGIERVDWPRVAKVAEEGGEVIGALVKRQEGRATTGDLLDELGDVILAALAAADQLGESPSTVITRRWAEVSQRSTPPLAPSMATSP